MLPLLAQNVISMKLGSLAWYIIFSYKHLFTKNKNFSHLFKLLQFRRLEACQRIWTPKLASDYVMKNLDLFTGLARLQVAKIHLNIPAYVPWKKVLPNIKINFAHFNRSS